MSEMLIEAYKKYYMNLMRCFTRNHTGVYMHSC